MGQPKQSGKGEVNDGRYLAPEHARAVNREPKSLETATGAILEATARLVAAPARTGREDAIGGRWLESVRPVQDNLLTATLADIRARDEPPVFRVRTEPVLVDPRPARVTIHGKEYVLHRVVHGQVLGCSLADRQPGTIGPSLILSPPTIGITLRRS